MEEQATEKKQVLWNFNGMAIAVPPMGKTTTSCDVVKHFKHSEACMILIIENQMRFGLREKHPVLMLLILPLRTDLKPSEAGLNRRGDTAK